MKNMKRLSKVFVVLLVAIALTACGKKDGGKAEFKIGYASSGLNHPFQITLRDGVLEKAKELNVEVIVVDAQDDTAKQISSIEDLIQQKVNLIIINPVDSDAVATSIAAANKENIPVITVDRGANEGEVLTHIASDNVEGSKLAGDFIAESIGNKGNVVEIQGQPGAASARDRGKGFNDAIAAHPEIKNVYSQPADWDRNAAMTVMENALESNPDVVAVFAHNDEMALGALRAVESKGLQDKVIVVGFDAIDEAVTSVQEGKLAATIEQQPKLMGSLAVENAVKYLKTQEKLPEFIPVELKLVKK